MLGSWVPASCRKREAGIRHQCGAPYHPQVHGASILQEKTLPPGMTQLSASQSIHIACMLSTAKQCFAIVLCVKRMTYLSAKQTRMIRGSLALRLLHAIEIGLLCSVPMAAGPAAATGPPKSGASSNNELWKADAQNELPRADKLLPGSAVASDVSLPQPPPVSAVEDREER